MSAPIDDFRFFYRWLSNFHVAEIWYENVPYPSTEHAYQAAKSLDPQVRIAFAELETPRDAKRAGKTVKLRPDWEYVKNRVMFDVCLTKFTSHPELRQLLIDTRDAELIEGNTWGDTYWGVCNGVGRNQLGTTLMLIRDIVNVKDRIKDIREIHTGNEWIPTL